jgi:tripartite-type tricarboxylate transporter receptor subunit TctC
MREYFASQGFFVGGNSPAAFRAFVEKEIPKWAQIVKAANVTVQ